MNTFKAQEVICVFTEANIDIHNHLYLHPQAALTDATSENSRLKDENTLLKAQLSTAASIQPAPSVDVNIQLEYQQKLSALTEEVNRLNAVNHAANEELARTKKDQDDLLELLADQVGLLP